MWVGRHNELKRMHAIWDENYDEPARPSTIAIGGPCGIGKSRLALEFIEECKFDVKLIVNVESNVEDLNKYLKPFFGEGYNRPMLEDNLKDYIADALQEHAKKVSLISL